MPFAFKPIDFAKLLLISLLCLGCLHPMVSLASDHNLSTIKKFYDLNDPEFLTVKQKADKGDAKAQFQVGVTYNNVNSWETRAEALRWFEKSGKQGFAEALFAEGYLYYEQYYFRDYLVDYPKLKNKQLLTQHINKMWDFFKQAEAKGALAKAQFALGYLNDEGIGKKEDNQKAIFWYQKAATQGLPEAQYNLGLLYADGGKDIIVDKRQAFYWYQKAVENGELRANYQLAKLYEKGEGVAKDKAKAMQMYEKLAYDHWISSELPFEISRKYFEDTEGGFNSFIKGLQWYCYAVMNKVNTFGNYGRSDAKSDIRMTDIGS